MGENVGNVFLGIPSKLESLTIIFWIDIRTEEIKAFPDFQLKQRGRNNSKGSGSLFRAEEMKQEKQFIKSSWKDKFFSGQGILVGGSG